MEQAPGPIERRKVYELVAERLIEEISAQRLRPGDPLPAERSLSESYGVGRSSIREALRMLESQGLIRSVGSGAFAVAEHSNPLNASLALLLTMQDGDLGELFEVRRILEVETAGLAAERRGDADVERMRRALEAMEEGLGSQDRYITGDLEFHQAVVAATGNRIALHVMHAIRDVIRRALISIYQIPGSPERSNQQHRQVFEAILGRDADLARQRMREHLLRVQREVEASARSGDGRKGEVGGG